MSDKKYSIKELRVLLSKFVPKNNEPYEFLYWLSHQTPLFTQEHMHEIGCEFPLEDQAVCNCKNQETLKFKKSGGAEVERKRIKEIVERMRLISKAPNGSTWSDTDMDSKTVRYGHDLAIDDILKAIDA